MKCPHCKGTGELDAGRMSFGALLRMHRSLRGLTQDQVAEAAGVSRAQIANLEAGRGDVPLKRIMRLAQAVGCDARDLIPQEQPQ